MLRSVSHDLRSPITAILTASEVAARRRVGRRADELLDVDPHAGGSGSTGSSRTCSTSRGSRRAPPRRSSRSGRSTASSRGRWTPIGAGGDAVDVSLPHEPLAVRVDAAQLEHALVNLLENALKVSPSVRLDVAPRNGEVVFRVADDGPGIAADERDAIFEPFARGANANGSRGAGLGLAIARGFLEVNGGRLWLEPANGRGATFAFALPSVKGPA